LASEGAPLEFVGHAPLVVEADENGKLLSQPFPAHAARVFLNTSCGFNQAFLAEGIDAAAAPVGVIAGRPAEQRYHLLKGHPVLDALVNFVINARHRPRPRQCRHQADRPEEDEQAHR